MKNGRSRDQPASRRGIGIGFADGNVTILLLIVLCIEDTNRNRLFTVVILYSTVPVPYPMYARHF